MARVYPLFIQMPASYTSQTNKIYPVIYLTDAHYSFADSIWRDAFPDEQRCDAATAIIVAVSM